MTEILEQLKELKTHMETMTIPYDERIFPTTIDEAGKYLRKKIGDKNTSAIAGALCRFGWQAAQKEIVYRINEMIEDWGGNPNEKP